VQSFIVRTESRGRSPFFSKDKVGPALGKPIIPINKDINPPKSFYIKILTLPTILSYYLIMVKGKRGWPKRRILNQSVVRKFLDSLGFETERIIQPWRHLCAFGKYQGKNAIFKLSSTLVVSPKTKNEYAWNQAVNFVPASKRRSFSVPKNFTCGNFGKLFYFIAERFPGQPLVGPHSTDMRNVIGRIGQIAQAAYEIENLPIRADYIFAKSSQNKNRKVSVGQKLLTISKEWATQIPMNLDDFFQILEKSQKNLRTSVGHGDFTACQLYDINGKIGVIDGEHASVKQPLYYDIAHFYNRLRNNHKAQVLARQFLQTFKSILPAADRRMFWEELKPVLIQRYIGNLWEQIGNSQNLNELKPLGEEILQDKIV